MAPPHPRGPGCVQFWIYISESFHVNKSYFGSVVLTKKIFRWSHLWRGSGPLFEQFRIPYTQGWLKLASWFWRRRFLIFFNFQCIFTLLLLSPLDKGLPLYLQTPQDDLCQVLLNLALWCLRSRKCKSLQTDGKTDGRRTTGDQKSSFELSAQLS
jgi:hypothetical protein